MVGTGEEGGAEVAGGVGATMVEEAEVEKTLAVGVVDTAAAIKTIVEGSKGAVEEVAGAAATGRTLGVEDAVGEVGVEEQVSALLIVRAIAEAIVEAEFNVQSQASATITLTEVPVAVCGEDAAGVGVLADGVATRAGIQMARIRAGRTPKSSNRFAISWTRLRPMGRAASNCSTNTGREAL